VRANGDRSPDVANAAGLAADRDTLASPCAARDEAVVAIG
jgi:hypothetical protein